MSAATALVAVAVAAAPLHASHDLFRRISSGAINGNGALSANYAGASADGTRVFFTTTEQLAAGDTDAQPDIYQRYDGVTSRISAGQVNGNGAFPVAFLGTSGNGTRVFFATAEQLVASDTDAQGDIYQRSGSTTSRVSVGQVNGNGAFVPLFNGASADGARVFFTTAEKLVASDTDNVADVYRRASGTTTRMSVGAINGNGNFAAGFAGASANGSRLFFSTAEQLVAGDTDTQVDIYERYSGTTTRVSAGQVNGNGAFPAQFLRSSADGTRVFFATAERLVAGDTDSQVDIYQRSGGTTTRISAGAINGNGAFGTQLVGISTDGTRAFFVSNEQLVAGDTDAQSDIYQRSAGTTTRISVGAINGNGPAAASFSGASADGTRVFFTTAEPLVSSDTDGGANDVYMRAGGNTTRVSAGEINGNGAFPAQFVGASADGSDVFFITLEQLTTADGDGGVDVYERSGGETSVVSPGDGNFAPIFKFVSTDGSRVFYETQEKVLANDKDAFTDVYGAYTGL